MHSVKCPSGEKCAICARSHSRWVFTPDTRDSIRIVASSFAIELRTNKKCTGAVAPSSGFLTDLRRSGCRSGGHQPQALLPRCNHHSRGSYAGGQVGTGSEFPQIANFASSTATNCASRMMLWKGWTRDSPSRAAFVHIAGRPSASAYRRPAMLRPPAPRARRSQESMLRRGRAARVRPARLPANCDRLEKTWLPNPRGTSL